MKKFIRLAGIGVVVGLGVLLLTSEFASGGRGRGGGGGGGGRGGGMSRPSGGGVSRPSGGGVSRPSGGVSHSPSINRSPSVSAPKISQPSVNRPSVQPKVGGGAPKIGGGAPKIGGGTPKISAGGGLGARDGPGVVTSPKLTPGTRPVIGAGKGPSIAPPKIGGIGDKGVVGKGGIGNKGVVGKGGIGDKGIVGKGGIGEKGVVGKGVVGKGAPGVGTRPGGPSVLPGLGLGLGAGLAAGKAGDVLGRRQEGVTDRKANIADRSQNLQDRMNDRQDFRGQSQDKRQDYANNRREDWQNWHDDYHGHHNDWYHGGWSDHWGDGWQHMWSEHTAAMVLGTTMWGLNRMNYWFGYSDYSNPYYSEPLVVDNTTINYSEPLAAPPTAPAATEPGAAPAALPPGVTQEGMAQFEAARTAFMGGNYQTALQATNKALASMPTDAVIHEFRALVLFALGNYKEAATTLHPVLAVGPGWDWTTMSSLYPDNDTYTKQLRALEDYVGAHPKSTEAHFVLAYHYLTCGEQEKSAAELLQVQRALPGDTVSAQLLQLMGKSATPPPPAVESEEKIDAAKLVGNWKAGRGGKATFEMTLGKDKSFTWAYREGKKKEEVKGVYAIDGNVLALEPDAGGVMLAEITEPKNGSFVFRTVGAPKNDPGLTFKGK